MKTINLKKFQLDLQIHECFAQGTRDVICRIENQQLFLAIRGTGSIKQHLKETIQLDPTLLENIIKQFGKGGLMKNDKQSFNPKKAHQPKGLVKVALKINTGFVSYAQTHFGDKSQLAIHDFLTGWLQYLDNLIQWEMQAGPRIIHLRRAVA